MQKAEARLVAEGRRDALRDASARPVLGREQQRDVVKEASTSPFPPRVPRPPPVHSEGTVAATCVAPPRAPLRDLACTSRGPAGSPSGTSCPLNAIHQEEMTSGIGREPPGVCDR